MIAGLNALQCQVLLWIDSKTVAPRSPILLDLETPQYKRYEVNLGLPDMPQIIVRTEKRGDAMIIEVRPKPGTGPERAMLPSSKSQGVEPEVVSCLSFRIPASQDRLAF